MQHTFESEKAGVLLTVVEQWSEWIPVGETHWHWKTFNPIKVEFELDTAMGDIEFQLIVLGLGFIFRCKYKDDADLFKEIQEQVKDIKEKHDIQ